MSKIGNCTYSKAAFFFFWRDARSPFNFWVFGTFGFRRNVPRIF